MKKEMRYLIGTIIFLLTLVHFCVNIATAETTYFPRIVCTNGWQTEIGVINPSHEITPALGVLQAYSKNGELLGSKSVSIPTNGRETFIIGSITELGPPNIIAYCTLDDIDYAGLIAYSEWSYEGILKAAAPAPRQPADGKIVLGHILCNEIWRTEISLLNTDDVEHVVRLTFDNGSQKELILAGHSLYRGYLRDLFDGNIQPDINSVSISDAAGLVGLLMTISYADNCSSIAAALPITDRKTSTIYYPHVSCNNAKNCPGEWYSNLVITNPNDENATCQCRIYNDTGQLVTNETLVINSGDSYDSMTCDQEINPYLQLNTNGALTVPEDNCWLKVDTDDSLSLCGSEYLISAPADPAANPIVNQMGALNAASAGHLNGIFTKYETNDGWSGLAFVNLGAETATINLAACNNDGLAKGITSLSIAAYAKTAVPVVNAFSEYDISAAHYIGYNSDQEILTYQCNGSTDGLTFDILPGIEAPFTVIDNDGDGYPAGLDCNDNNANEHPGQIWYRDSDGDGYGNPNNSMQSCSQPTGYVVNSNDCNDSDANEYPGQIWYRDADGDLYSNGVVNNTSCLRPEGFYPAGELTATSGDNDDSDNTIYPGAPELCDGKDNDQDGMIDEDAGDFYYRDRDGDGYGDPDNSMQSCSQPTGYITDSSDCNDTDASINPGALEIYNDGIDQNCDDRDLPEESDVIGIWEGIRTYYYYSSEYPDENCQWNDSLELYDDHTFRDSLTYRSGDDYRCEDSTIVGRWRLEKNVIYLETLNDYGTYISYRDIFIVDNNHLFEKDDYYSGYFYK